MTLFFWLQTLAERTDEMSGRENTLIMEESNMEKTAEEEDNASHSHSILS